MRLVGRNWSLTVVEPGRLLFRHLVSSPSVRGGLVARPRKSKSAAGRVPCTTGSSDAVGAGRATGRPDCAHGLAGRAAPPLALRSRASRQPESVIRDPKPQATPGVGSIRGGRRRADLAAHRGAPLADAWPRRPSSRGLHGRLLTVRHDVCIISRHGASHFRRHSRQPGLLRQPSTNNPCARPLPRVLLVHLTLRSCEAAGGTRGDRWARTPRTSDRGAGRALFPAPSPPLAGAQRRARASSAVARSSERRRCSRSARGSGGIAGGWAVWRKFGADTRRRRVTAGRWPGGRAGAWTSRAQERQGGGGGARPRAVLRQGRARASSRRDV